MAETSKSRRLDPAAVVACWYRERECGFAGGLLDVCDPSVFVFGVALGTGVGCAVGCGFGGGLLFVEVTGAGLEVAGAAVEDDVGGFAVAGACEF